MGTGTRLRPFASQEGRFDKPSQRVAALLFFVLVAGTVARFFQLAAPPFGHHAQRQYDTAAIARNFYQGPMNILYPAVDWGGNSPGYVQSEFPIYSFFVAVLYRIFGVHEWLGSLTNIAIFVISALLLFRLGRRLFDDWAALIAVFFYACLPLSFYFTRSFQPDALMALGTLAGIYYWQQWVEDGWTTALIASAIGICVAILIKPTSVYLVVPMVYTVHRRFGWRFLRLPSVWLVAAAVLIPPVLWYWHAATIWKVYGNSFYIAYLKLGMPGLRDSFWLHMGKILSWRAVHEMPTLVGLPFVALGIFRKPRNGNCIPHWWALGFAVSILAWPQGYYRHDYYQLPIVFVVTMWMGCGVVSVMEKIPNTRMLKTSFAVLACMAVLAWSLHEIRWLMRISEEEQGRMAFARSVSQLTEPSSHVTFLHTGWVTAAMHQHRTADGEYLFNDPEDFYLSNRKGWSIDESLLTTSVLETLRGRGAQYFAFYHSASFELPSDIQDWLNQNYTPIEVNAHWAIYRMENRPEVNLGQSR